MNSDRIPASAGSARRSARITVAYLVLAAVLTAAPVGSARAGFTPVFTYPPTDIANIAGVVPLGNLNPGGGHVLAVDHMYLRYADQSQDGSAVYPVRAMAGGRIIAVMIADVGGSRLDYDLYIKHSRHVASYFIHLNELSQRIRTHLESTGAGWIPVGEPGMQIMLLGRLGAPAELPVEAGEQVGTTANFSEMWDVGVIDDREKGSFEGKGLRRYPRFRDYLNLLGHHLPDPLPGQQTINAASFIKYLAPEHKEAWFNQLVSVPKMHGQSGWDVQGRLRGAWFNPDVDAISPPPLFDLESAVVSIVPYNYAPTTKTQIGIASGSPLAALDPEGRYPQLLRPFVVETNKSPGAKVNPDPAIVGPESGTVCYELCYGDGSPTCNTLLLRMTAKRQVAIKFDPTPLSAPNCDGKLSEGPDETWVVYER